MTKEILKLEWELTKSQLEDAIKGDDYQNDSTKKYLAQHTISVIEMFIRDLEKIE